MDDNYKQYTRIIIELHNVCNRKCDFCITKFFNETHYITDQTINSQLCNNTKITIPTLSPTLMPSDNPTMGPIMILPLK